jgi:hypothetical protein
MTEAEEQELRAMGGDIAGAMQSQDEPLCVARAFATPKPGAVVFTMQAWIDLELIRSPLLRGELPESANELQAAALLFGMDTEELTGEELVDLGRAIIRAIQDGFSMALSVQPTGEIDESPSAPIGNWLRIFSCLVTQCRLSDERALAIQVGRAYALIAGMRCNQGWRVTGTPYALREIGENTQHPTSNTQHPMSEEGAERPGYQPSTLNSQLS